MGDNGQYDEREACLHIGNYYGSGSVGIIWFADYNGTIVLHHGSAYDTAVTIFDGDISVWKSYGNYGDYGTWYYGLVKNTSDNPYYIQLDAAMAVGKSSNVVWTSGKYGKSYLQLQKNQVYAFSFTQSTGGGASLTMHAGTFPTA